MIKIILLLRLKKELIKMASFSQDIIHCSACNKGQERYLHVQENGKLFPNKSLEGFKNQIKASKVQSEIERDIARVATFGGLEAPTKDQDITIGHGQAVGKGGTDIIGNTAPEVGKRESS